jgi:hypothetical protein
MPPENVVAAILAVVQFGWALEPLDARVADADFCPANQTCRHQLDPTAGVVGFRCTFLVALLATAIVPWRREADVGKWLAAAAWSLGFVWAVVMLGAGGSTYSNDTTLTALLWWYSPTDIVEMCATIAACVAATAAAGCYAIHLMWQEEEPAEVEAPLIPAPDATDTQGLSTVDTGASEDMPTPLPATLG